MQSTKRFPGWRWMAGFVAFPVAGLLGRAAGGPVDHLEAAIVGGVVTGAALGAGQWLASGRSLGRAWTWTVASAAGYGAGLGVGSAAVGYGTGLGDLAVMGAVTGIAFGGAQALALARREPLLARVWAAAMPALLALGWTVTSLAGIAVDRQYTVFGASGALVVTALSGLLIVGVRASAVTPSTSAAFLAREGAEPADALSGR